MGATLKASNGWLSEVQVPENHLRAAVLTPHSPRPTDTFSIPTGLFTNNIASAGLAGSSWCAAIPRRTPREMTRWMF
jgi:hypothetical protein